MNSVRIKSRPFFLYFKHTQSLFTRDEEICYLRLYHYYKCFVNEINKKYLNLFLNAPFGKLQFKGINLIKMFYNEIGLNVLKILTGVICYHFKSLT